MEAIWVEARPRILDRVAALESAAAAAIAGELTEEQRSVAESEAHKLAGSLGMFGFPEGSRVALAIEQTLDGPQPVASQFAEQVRALAAALEERA